MSASSTRFAKTVRGARTSGLLEMSENRECGMLGDNREKVSRLRQTADVNLYHVTKFFPYFPFTPYRFYTKISSFMRVLTLGIVRNCFYCLFSILRDFQLESDVCLLR